MDLSDGARCEALGKRRVARLDVGGGKSIQSDLPESQGEAPDIKSIGIVRGRLYGGSAGGEPTLQVFGYSLGLTRAERPVDPRRFQFVELSFGFCLGFASNGASDCVSLVIAGCELRLVTNDLPVLILAFVNRPFIVSASRLLWFHPFPPALNVPVAEVPSLSP